ncbi:molybdopterin-dependent oxidoreductase [Amaricoccus solimangrovi]|uniref:Oxidoreductase n=1 Tax=Amaricoccus solimangrovi TaxID=2589815 RepID=A0A501WH94_9RHOB|nr:molybdopterin-dependent oxidoreductase [Amaricoccus solimangrovi]TPE47474.1 oxidoreductase [Amaricoccus solimangrovi]
MANRHVIETRSGVAAEPRSPGRRRFFVGAASLAAGAVAAGATGWAAEAAEAPLTIAEGGRGPTRLHPSFVKDVGLLTDLNKTNQGGAWWNFDTYITPVEQFYIRNEYPTPRAEIDRRVDPRHWRLRIHGDAVERPLEITYDDLLRMPSRSIMSVMQCAGNGRTLFWEQEGMTAEPTKVGGNGWGLGGVGMAEWQYVPMSHILGLVGLRPNAKACLFWSGVDGKAPNTESDTGRPLPVRELIERGDDIGLAFKMNGMPLPPDHGAPVRALVPGWCGGASTKWLTEIKIASHDFWVRLNTLGHSNIGPDYTPPIPAPDDEFRFVTPKDVVGVPVTWHVARSMLTIPLVLERQPDMPGNYPLARGEWPAMPAGPQTLRGYAWAPRYGVERVDARVNGGEWQAARIIDVEPNRYSWVRFELPFAPLPGEYLIETRVTDRNGGVQPVSVPYNKGGYDYGAIPIFKARFA